MEVGELVQQEGKGGVLVGCSSMVLLRSGREFRIECWSASTEQNGTGLGWSSKALVHGSARDLQLHFYRQFFFFYRSISVWGCSYGW